MIEDFSQCVRLYSFDCSRMFPHLQLSVTGLQKDLLYCVFVELVLASPHRHKYSGSNAFDENMNMLGGAGGWTNAGQAESQPSPEQRIYVHPDSPASGTHWMQQMVCFNKLKITNDSSKRGSNVRAHEFTGCKLSFALNPQSSALILRSFLLVRLKSSEFRYDIFVLYLFARVLIVFGGCFLKAETRTLE